MFVKILFLTTLLFYIVSMTSPILAFISYYQTSPTQQVILILSMFIVRAELHVHIHCKFL